MRNRRVAVRLFSALILLLGAWWNVRDARRVDLTVLQERAEVAVPLDAQLSLTQSFVPLTNHLTALEFNAQVARTSSNPNAMLTLHLRRDTLGSPDLARTQITLAFLRDNPQFTFSFPPESDSSGRTYYVMIETDAEPGALALWASLDNAFDDGALYPNGQPTLQDLTMRAYGQVTFDGMLSDFFAHVEEFFFLLGFTLVLASVGAGCLAAFRVHGGETLSEHPVTALFLGSALAPVSFAVASLFPLLLSRALVLALTVGALCAAGLFLLRARDKRIFGRLNISDFLLALFFSFALAVRVLQIADLGAPLWVDGLIHENLVEMILAELRLPPDSLYHLGFHSLVAFVHDVLNISEPELILRIGAWASALTGLSLWALARKLLNDDFAALCAACVIWFFAPFPSYLLTWSRLPFLLGLAFLPIAITVTLDALERGGRGRLAYASLIVAGLALTHYGAVSLWGMFVVVWIIISLSSPALLSPTLRSGDLRPEKGKGVARAFIVAFPAIFLLGARLASNLFNPRLPTLIASSRVIAEQIDPAYLFQLTLRHGGIWVWGVATFGMLVALFAQRRIFWLLVTWFGVEFLLARVQAPFFGEVIANTTNTIIALCVTLALFGGMVGKWVMEVGSRGLEVGGWKQRVCWLSALGYLLVLALMGGRNLVGVVNPVTVQFTPADARAMEWINANTTPEARFMANSFYWGGARYLPVDGGGWVRAFTNRVVEFPHTQEQAAHARELIREKNISHVYLGHGSGLLERALFDSRDFQVMYDKEGVRIYQVKSEK